MKKLIIVRHAAYDGNKKDPGLSDFGRIQAKDLGAKIKSLLPDGEQVEVWTSPAARAFMTAEIIADKINVSEVIDKDKLWSDNWHPHDFKWLKDEIKAYPGESLVIITHLEYVQDFPMELGFTGNGASYAQGVLIENNKITNI